MYIKNTKLSLCQGPKFRRFQPKNAPKAFGAGRAYSAPQTSELDLRAGAGTKKGGKTGGVNS